MKKPGMRKDRGVDHAQALNALHFEVGVKHRVLSASRGSDPAGPAGVVAPGLALHPSGDLGVVLDVGLVLPCRVLLVLGHQVARAVEVLGELADELHSFDDRAEVVPFGVASFFEVAEHDLWSLLGIGRAA